MMRNNNLIGTLLIFLVYCCSGCHQRTSKELADPLTSSWSVVSDVARGETVTMMMWQGDALINGYMKDYVAPELKKQFNITLHVVGGQGSQIVAMQMAEREAKKTDGEIDLVWINGETFYQLKQINALFGPFVNHLPNSKLIDLSNPFIGYDFQEKVTGMECPWGNVQLCLIYNSKYVTDPPADRAALETFVKAHPGVFTIGTDFTGLTFLKSLLIDIAGSPAALAGKFNDNAYAKYSHELWMYINRIKPYFWKEGTTFPASVAQMHQLYNSGELYFTMSNNDGEVDNKVAQHIFPETSRSYVLASGTIQNSHYLGIPKNSAHKSAAMVVINFMISPAAQYKKAEPAVWGDGTVLNVALLPDSVKHAFERLGARHYGPLRSEIQSHALMELDPEYMIRLNDDFRKYVIEQ